MTVSSTPEAAPQRFRLRLPQGPKLQFLNLTILLTVIFLSRFLPEGWPKIDYPTRLSFILVNLGLAAVLDAAISKWRFGEWRMPWPTMVGSLGITLVINGNGNVCAGDRAVSSALCAASSWGPLASGAFHEWLVGAWPFILLPILMVGSKHLIRWRGRHLFNPNNFAAAILLLFVLARVGVNDWGAAPQTVALMLLFGSISTIRVKKFDLAVIYLVLSWLAYFVVAQFKGWELATVWMFALAPLQVVIAFFAITDPATSPTGRLEKVLWAGLIVLLGVPATLAGYPEAPIFALLLAAPQRHLVTYLVTGKWPPKAPTGPPKPTPASATTTGAILPRGDSK